MAEAVKENIKEARAILGDLKMSPRKVRLVCDLIKHKPVALALVQLRLITKKAALPITKLLNSAVANASNNFKLDPSLLRVKNITVDQGGAVKRYKPRAQGRALPIRHRISVVRIILEEDASLKGKGMVVKVASKKKRMEEHDHGKDPENSEDKDIKRGATPHTELPAQTPKKAEVKRRLFNRKTNA